MDWEEVLEQRATEERFAEKLGITLRPEATALSGQQQSEDPSSDGTSAKGVAA
jgi:hypothetical protein